ncbi:PSMC3 interacting protein [Mortierella alpina]|nr:PSMC3 interacting protein [Mortierella alpina]
MTQTEFIPCVIPSARCLASIPNEIACSEYLAELVDELPLAASQFGLVLATALDLEEKAESRRPVAPEVATVAQQEVEQPHYRSHAVPLAAAAEHPSTVVDATLYGYAATFYARCESLLMQAAISTASANETSKEERTRLASSENMSLALQSSTVDPVVQEHYKNVFSVVSEIFSRRSADGVSSKEGETKDTEEACDSFYCINDIWRPVLESHASITESTRGVKFVISEEDLLAAEPGLRSRCLEVLEDQGLVLGPMVEADIKLMIESNHIPYSEDYGRQIIKRSQCFRNRTGDMVAWAGTHGDFSIAALHVLPEYRKLGLGRLVLQSLALMHVRLARHVLSTRSGDVSIPRTRLYAHADCVDDNFPTMVFMERCGWRRIGNYLWVNVVPHSQARSEKKQAVSKGGDKSEKLVLDYLVKQNRPYSVTDIVSNLHSAVSKTECQRVMNALVDKDLVTMKLYGKQAIYVARQDTIETATPEQLAAVDSEISSLQTLTAEAKSKNKQLTSELSALKSALTTEQVTARLEQLRSKNEKSKEHLDQLRAGTQLVTAEEKTRVVKEMEKHRKLWIERRRLFKDMFATVTENFPSKPKDLLEELDIDTQDPIDVNTNPLQLMT